MTEESKTPETEDTTAGEETEAATEAATESDAGAAAAETEDAAQDGPADDEAADAGDAPEAAGEAEDAPAEDDSATEAPSDEADDDAGPADEAAEEPAEESAEEPAEESTEAATEEPAEEKIEYTFDMLHDMNVHQLQEVAATVDHQAVHGYSTMHKEHLIHALCQAFGIEEHVHHEVVGIDKVAIKAKINALKIERDAALEAGDKKRLKQVRRRIHNLKHRIRKATV